MCSSTWRQPFDKWPSRVIKMPPKPKGKKSQSNAKHSTEKTTRQKKKAPPKKPPAKTGSRASETSGDSTRTGQKRRKTKSTGSPLAKRSKTRPLTAADIPDIVSAVVKAMPQPQDATSSTPQRSSRRVQDTTDQASQSTCNRSTLPITDPQDSTDEDAENEDFGKLLYIVCVVLWQLIIGWHAMLKRYITHTMLMLMFLCNAHHSLIIMCIMPN